MADEELYRLSTWIKNIEELISFKFMLNYCQFTSEGMYSLGVALRKHTKILHFDFNCSDYPSLGGAYLEEALADKNSLLDLKL